MTDSGPTADRRVFLSYAYEDRELAQRISHALAQSGIGTTNAVSDLSPGEDLKRWLDNAIRASDLVVVLLTPRAGASRWVRYETEYSRSLDLDRRGADVIPVLAAQMDVPPALRDRAVVDLTADVDTGIQRLVEQIQTSARVDFSAMTPRTFEEFVADLLRAVGFHVDEFGGRLESGVDMRATYQRTDPFGSPETELWFVQAKLYSHERVSVRTIRELAGTLTLAGGSPRGLLVTNAQLTSVALEYVTELERSSHVRLRALDGVQLKNLLRRFPTVAARYFGGTAEAKPGLDNDT